MLNSTQNLNGNDAEKQRAKRNQNLKLIFVHHESPVTDHHF